MDWEISKSMVVINPARHVKSPTKFLTSQMRLNIDAVKLVREIREDF